MGKFTWGSRLSITDRLAAESSAGVLEVNRAPTVPTVPDPGQSLPSLTGVASQMKDWMEMREGISGSVLDKFITLRDLMNEGAVKINIAGKTISGTGVSNVSVGSGFQNPLPILLTPPAITNFTAQGAFKNVILTWDQAAFANYAYGEVWRSSSNALGTAVLIGTTTSDGYTDANVVVGATYYYWVRLVAIGGVLGPFNAVGGTSAALLTIGNTDLSNLVVTAEKLSQGTFPNVNLVANAGGEDYVSGTLAPKAWYISAGASAGSDFLSDAAQQAGGAVSMRLHKNNAGDAIGVASTAFPVIPGETYALRIRYKASNGLAAGFYFRIIFNTTLPGVNYIDSTNFAGGANFHDTLANAAVTTSWQTAEDTVTVPAGMLWASINCINWSSTPTAETIWFDDVSVGRQITASFMAANSIAVGTAAIQNGAIVNAMIANLAVDNAKIANATITGGKIAVNTITAGNIAANTITTDRLIANAATSAGNSALSITGTTYTGVTSLSPANQNIVSLTTTGAPVTGQGWLKITGRVAATTATFDNVGIAFSVDDGSTVVATGGAQLAQCFISHSTPTFKHIWGNTAIPISFRYTPAAGTYTFRAVSMSVTFFDTSGNPISLTGDYDIIGYLVVQENKV